MLVSWPIINPIIKTDTSSPTAVLNPRSQNPYDTFDYLTHVIPSRVSEGAQSHAPE